jgi:anti-sigma factor RsiW
MLCERFLDDYSDYRDGLLPEKRRVEFEAHLKACPHCARYHRVMGRGVQLLCSMPSAESSDDFMPRLRHRLYNVDEGVMHPYRRRFGGSAALIGVAAVGILALFWLPFAASVPVELELPAVAVEAPPRSAELVPALFRQGPFVSDLLDAAPSMLDGGDVEWPPRSHVHQTVILDASYRRVVPAPSR